VCDDKRRRGAKDKVFGSRWFPPLLQFGQPLLGLRFILPSPTPPSSRSSPLRRAFPSPACPPRSPQTLALSSSRRLSSLSSSSRFPFRISPPFLGSGTRSSSCPRMASDGTARGRPPKLPAHEGLDPSNVLTYKRRRRGTCANAGHSAVTPGPDPVKVRIPPPNPSSPLPQLVVLCYDDDMGFTRASVSPASRCLQLLVDFVHMPPDFGSVLQDSLSMSQRLLSSLGFPVMLPLVFLGVHTSSWVPNYRSVMAFASRDLSFIPLLSPLCRIR